MMESNQPAASIGAINMSTLQGGRLGDWAGAHAAAAVAAVAALAVSALLSFSFVVLQVSFAIPCAAAASPPLNCPLDVRVASHDATRPAASEQTALKHQGYRHLVLLIIRGVLLHRLLQLPQLWCSILRYSIITRTFLLPALHHAFAHSLLNSRTCRGVSENNVRQRRQAE